MSDPTRPSGPRRPPRPPQRGVTINPTAPTAPTAPQSPAPAKSPAPKARVEPVAKAPAPKAPKVAKEPKPSRPHVEDLIDTPPSTKSAWRQRYGAPYDTQGPKVRMGVLWAIVVVAALVPLALRPWGLAVLYGVVAGAAAAQVIDARRGDRGSIDRAVAAFAGSALPVAATLGARALGAGYLALVAVAVLAVFVDHDPARPPFGRAGRIVEAAGICGGAGAALVLLAEYEFAALIILLVFVMVYDASDFIVGSGASNGIEGPLAGALFIGATAAIFAVVNAPPFRGADIWSFAMLAMIACPAGQIVASAMLPQANTHAPALRRLDTMLVVAPAWAGLVGLYLTHGIQ